MRFFCASVSCYRLPHEEKNRTAMTYNFDPDQWFDMQRTLLEKALQEGRMNDQEFNAAIRKIEEKYNEMWKRLDGYFQLPEK